MTTNHPEKLDEALIRPGRVDHQVPFDYASQHQIRELFIRMYRDDVELGDEVISVSSTQSSAEKEKEQTPLVPISASKAGGLEGLEITPPATPVTDSDRASGDDEEPVGGEEEVVGENEGKKGEEMDLDDIAKAFSERIPNGVFSPAEIQGFLLKRKKDPKRALDEIADWVEGLKGGRGFAVGGGR